MSQSRKGPDLCLPAWAGETNTGRAVAAPPVPQSLRGAAAVAAVVYAASAGAFYPAAAPPRDADAAAAPGLPAAVPVVHPRAAAAVHRSSQDDAARGV